MAIQTFAPALRGGMRARTSTTARNTIDDLTFALHGLNRHSTNLAIMKYFDFQGYMITGQHSGTHWIKWMLSHALAHRYGVEPPRYFNNDSSNQLVGHPKHRRMYPQLPRLASTHQIPPFALDWSWLRAIRRPPPYVVIVRDLRQAMVSCYEKYRGDSDIPFSRFVAGAPRGHGYPCDAWWYVRFLNRWGEIASRYPDQTLVLRYEDFRQEPLENLGRLARHFGLDLGADDLAHGVAMGAKDVMARCQDPEVHEKPLRADGHQGARFTADDRRVLQRILDRHLKHDFGYGYCGPPRGYQIPVRPTPPMRKAA